MWAQRVVGSEALRVEVSVADSREAGSRHAAAYWASGFEFVFEARHGFGHGTAWVGERVREWVGSGWVWVAVVVEGILEVEGVPRVVVVVKAIAAVAGRPRRGDAHAHHLGDIIEAYPSGGPYLWLLLLRLLTASAAAVG